MFPEVFWTVGAMSKKKEPQEAFPADEAHWRLNLPKNYGEFYLLLFWRESFDIGGAEMRRDR